MTQHVANLRRLALLGAMIAINPRTLDILPNPPSPKPKDTTPADRARIEAAEQKRKMRQAKRAAARGENVA